MEKPTLCLAALLILVLQFSDQTHSSRVDGYTTQRSLELVRRCEKLVQIPTYQDAFVDSSFLKELSARVDSLFLYYKQLEWPIIREIDNRFPERSKR